MRHRRVKGYYIFFSAFDVTDAPKEEKGDGKGLNDDLLSCYGN